MPTSNLITSLLILCILISKAYMVFLIHPFIGYWNLFLPAGFEPGTQTLKERNERDKRHEKWTASLYSDQAANFIFSQEHYMAKGQSCRPYLLTYPSFYLFHGYLAGARVLYLGLIDLASGGLRNWTLFVSALVNNLLSAIDYQPLKSIYS